MKRQLLIFVLLGACFSYGFYAKINLADKITSQFLFSPDTTVTETPSDYDLKYEEVFIDVDESKLYGWYIPAKNQTDKYVIYLHGSKGNISTYLGAIKQLYKVGVNILLIDYEGFGKSTGNALIKNGIKDSLAMYDYLIDEKKADPENISLFGYSYGGGIAIELALRRKVRAILLESTFSSLKQIATLKYSFAVLPFIPDNLLDTVNNLKKIKVPIIIAYAGKDQIVPIDNSQILFEKANEPKYLFEVKDAYHHNIFKFVTPEYTELIRRVLFSL